MTNLLDKIVVYFYKEVKAKELVQSFARSKEVNFRLPIQLKISYSVKEITRFPEYTKGDSLDQLSIIKVVCEFTKQDRKADLKLVFSSFDRIHKNLEVRYNLAILGNLAVLFELQIQKIEHSFRKIDSTKSLEIRSSFLHNSYKTEFFDCHFQSITIRKGSVYIDEKSRSEFLFINNDSVVFAPIDSFDKDKVSTYPLVEQKGHNSNLKFQGEIKKVLLANHFGFANFSTKECQEVVLINSSVQSLEFNNCIIGKIELYKSFIQTISLKEVKGETKTGQSLLYDKRIIYPSKFILEENKFQHLIIKEQEISDNTGLQIILNNQNLDKNLEIETSMVKWNYGGIKDLGKYYEDKRRFLNALKHHYENRQNTFQSQVINALEKKWYLTFYKWDFSLFMSSISNDFGLSLTLPLTWIVFLLLLQTYLLITISGICGITLSENWGLFFNILNPTHNSSIFLDVLKDCSPSSTVKNFIYLIDNVIRIFMGYMIFQFAVAFRYKYRLK